MNIFTGCSVRPYNILRMKTKLSGFTWYNEIYIESLLIGFDGWALKLFVLTPCRFLHSENIINIES